MEMHRSLWVVFTFDRVEPVFVGSFHLVFVSPPLGDAACIARSFSLVLGMKRDSRRERKEKGDRSDRWGAEKSESRYLSLSFLTSHVDTVDVVGT